jgi:hypothetical protein
MGVLLLTTGDELRLVDGVDALLLNIEDGDVEPACVILALSTPDVEILLDGPSVSIELTTPEVSIVMEKC